MYYLIRSKVDPKSVRIVQAKSRSAAIAHVYADNWEEPVKASVEDMAYAASQNVKPEVARESTEG